MTLSINEWLATADTGDVLHDTAVIEVAFAQAIGGALTERKQEIQDLSDKIKAINQLSDLLRSKRPTGSTVTATGDLGTDKAAIIAGMKAYCPDIDTSEANGGSLQQATIDQWLQALSGASGDLSNESQQVQSDVSSLLGRYNGAMDSASGIVKKRENLGDGAANNFRAA